MINKATQPQNYSLTALRLCGFALIVILGFGVVFVLSNYVDARRVSLPESYDDSNLSFQGKRLKGFALGGEGLLADWYWMRALQYMGEKIIKADGNINIEDLSSLNPRLLYPMLDNATDLDPKFMAAYSYGAIVLPAIDRDQAVALTEKGIANNPDAWRLFQYLGYIYWRADDFANAANVYDRGSKINGAPPFLKQMSAAMRTQGGSRDTARQIYTQMRNESEDQQSRQNAELRLMQLDSLDELDAVNSSLKALTANGSPCPKSLAPVMPLLRDIKLPGGRNFRVNEQRQLVDPSGVPYFLDEKTCTAYVDGINSKIPKL